ncbi:CusA/CzcA family heavy metal efflux RND transporter [Luteirhabdus pelagi]|uniref:CusA/CzcA family heavy metal efflux RND transporter n=1 Tax=Luteirhabdus pelagi TaxID=2792783 RepID=UPI00193948D6|nr:CusA/CzcA family heavy metal efflux RND transporter [Luteirhabdus pelagi]
MLSKLIRFSVKNKLIIGLFTLILIGVGIFSLTKLSIGAVPDVTNNQVQVITTSRNLSTQDMEKFITYPVELEMANLPGVKEIRSVSKFGLSVVTIVFDEELGTYLPRQLISEKIKSASENIPEGFGTPQMGPITTGLGEIYQYILDVKPGYEDRYTIMELRTIQDWIVRRQLSGIPGVVEVNTWGGYLKQYEVAINTAKLNAMNISAGQVFEALEKNNSVSGGGYIEKKNQAYFIRGEGLVASLDDIRNIVVKTENGFPIYIKNIATVQFGSATRFGAITGNGEGEKVLGQVMMLKDGNSKKVIDAVKERVAQISGSLPEGVFINPIVDRSELVGRTTFTIAENLILGCLIVIFVVVLLLGNLRSGLVVASVIPLSLLFALTMMYVFDIDANLMSLGAIDFGIIIDGAVIIVEFIAFQMTSKATFFQNLNAKKRRDEKDMLAISGASKMMNSAIFGQLIILIVFIPILSLSGVEGKMFRPMALTFSFALIGAMLLCLTYVPMAASLFLKPSKTSKNNISKRIVTGLTKLYEPIIRWALQSKRLVIGAAAVLLAFAIVLFVNMGGEFVPTLDEGDFVIQPVLKTGTSLEKTIETTTQIEQILLKEFPEVDQVVSRIGAAEVPTDPMSMEQSDVIITLKPKDEWVSADSKDELANQFKEALAVIPGMEVEFTQPIEMRFNELITGVRADIAIKIFGEDLDVLNAKANEIKILVEDVKGAADITVEKVVGLPQMSVSFNRAKIARYGLNIADLNQMISMGFAGQSLGSVFEGEKRFDLVLRLDKNSRRNLSNLQDMYVDLPNGGKVPLRELADISYTEGAAQISRDDTKRRIVVGINVRDRDLQSVVDDVRLLVEENIDLPVGYTVEYGGQFENLQSAKSRLLFAVPVALILIFFLLYFAFKSVREALMIYSAIPLAAVGGILLLWSRDMPFSISAGVGFIALFGVAVLNGIVLIEHFKELKNESFKSAHDLIITGAKDRLRAVLLTAMAAALGFLPMAVSTNAGAEVQRPLATVVIGGLITATLLTLIVLPVLFSLFDKDMRNMPKRSAKGVVVLLILLSSGIGMAQEEPKNLADLQQLALENNANLKASELRMEETEALIGSAFTFDKTQLFYSYNENDIAPNGEPLRMLGAQQDFKFPTVYFAQRKRNRLQYTLQQRRVDVVQLETQAAVASAYYQLQYERERIEVLTTLDSLYERFAYAAKRRFELGATNYLEKITAQAKQQDIEVRFKKASNTKQMAYNNLKKIVQSEDSIYVKREPMERLEIRLQNVSEHPLLQFYDTQQSYTQSLRNVEQQQLLPDLSLMYAVGSNPTLNDRLVAYQFGIKIPLLFSGNSSRIKASRIAIDVSRQLKADAEIHLKTKYQNLLQELEQYEATLSYYETEGEALSEAILNTATKSYKSGEIDFFQYIQSLENAYDIQLQYLENLNRYNQTIIAINYLTTNL